MVGAAGEVRRTWIAGAPSLVGLGADDPGAGWGQAPTEQEKKQGYKKTDVMTLQIKCSQLRAKLEDVLANVDAAATDPGSLAALKVLLTAVISCESEVALLANSGSSMSKYNQLTAKYNALAAEWAGYGIEEAAPPPVKSSSGTAGSPPVSQPATVVKPADPGKPTVTVKSKAGEWDWLLYAAGALAVVGVLIGTKVIKL